MTAVYATSSNNTDSSSKTSTTSKTVTNANTANKVAKAPELSKTEAVALTKQIKASLDTLPKLIVEAMQGKAYKAMGYTSVEAWSTTEFGFGRSRVYQLVKSVTLENQLRDTFTLAESWKQSEEHFRHLKGDDFQNLIETIKVALVENNVGNEAKDQASRQKLVSKIVQASYAENETKKILARKAKEAKASADAKADSTSVDTASIETKTITSNRIVRVPLNAELVKVKASDIAIIMARIADGDETLSNDQQLMALNDTMANLEELIAYYTDDSNEAVVSDEADVAVEATESDEAIAPEAVEAVQDITPESDVTTDSNEVVVEELGDYYSDEADDSTVDIAPEDTEFDNLPRTDF